MTEPDRPRPKPPQLELDSPGYIRVKEQMSRLSSRHEIRGDEAKLVAQEKAKTTRELEVIRQMGTSMLLNHVESIQTPYSEQWSNFAEKQGWMLDRLAGHQVFDLGGGDYRSKPSITFRRLLLERGVSEYYGVDMFGSYAGTRKDIIEMPFGPVIPNLDGRGAHIMGDMLDVVTYLPDGSTNFVLNGIDDLIVDTKTDYGKALTGHIERCTEPGGYVVGITMFGGVLEELSKLDSFDDESPENSRFYLLRKKDAATSSGSEQSPESRDQPEAGRA